MVSYNIYHTRTYFHRREFPKEVTRAVESFYQEDEFTRQMPGKKDFVSIANNVRVQKRLILSNLKELHGDFKRSHPNKQVRMLFLLINVDV